MLLFFSLFAHFQLIHMFILILSSTSFFCNLQFFCLFFSLVLVPTSITFYFIQCVPGRENSIDTQEAKNLPFGITKGQILVPFCLVEVGRMPVKEVLCIGLLVEPKPQISLGSDTLIVEVNKVLFPSTDTESRWNASS